MTLVESKTSVHWLTFSVKQRWDEVLEAIGGGWGKTERTGAYGQPSRVVHETGTAVYFGSPRVDQPVVVNLPGEACECWANEGLGWCVELGGRVTRLDVANDVGPDTAARGRLWEMVKCWKRGKVETKMRKTSHRMFTSDNPGEGHTAYFGGKTADLQLRAYDRRGPLRLEWQWRPAEGQALSVAGETLKRGAQAVWRQLSKSAVWPLPWWRQLATGEGVELPKLEDEQTALLDAIQAIALQWGGTFVAMEALGLGLDHFILPHQRTSELRGDVARKYLKWADEADELRYADGSKLRRAVKCRLRQERK